MDQAIIEKIKKLLALATSSNEHEARLAAEKANELLIRHNLKMQDLGEERDYRKKILHTGSRAPAQGRWIGQVLERRFFVAVVRVRIPSMLRTVLVIVGEPHNVEIAGYIFDFLFRAYPRLWAAARKAHRLRSKQRWNYYLGLTAGIVGQLGAMKERVETETGLTVIPDPKLPAVVNDLIGGEDVSRPPPKVRANWKARVRGMVDGKNLKIRQGITEHGDGPVRQIEGKA